jgi:glycerate kinase
VSVPAPVVAAPAPFKAALGAPDAARAIAAGFRLADPGVEVREVPVADGGEGTADALVAALGGRRRGVASEDPLGRPIDASIGELPDRVAVVELAQAAGYGLLDEGERDPERASTRGVGGLVRAALDMGARRIVVAVGGSATNDAALGAAVALGAVARDGDGVELHGRGGDLARVARLDLTGLDPRLAQVEIDVATDVDNPFHGPNGAAHVFGPQKGAGPAAVRRLDAGLVRFAGVLREVVGRDVSGLAGAGAAGGAAGGLVAMLGARIVPGADLVLDAVDLDGALEGAGLCVTGEGRLDATSARGKAPAAVAARCRARGVPCVALCGEIDLGPGAARDLGLAGAFPIARRRRGRAEALAGAPQDLAATAAAVGGLYARSFPA